jgi:t-SNARE complex subunit (syntaxin)
MENVVQIPDVALKQIGLQQLQLAQAFEQLTALNGEVSARDDYIQTLEQTITELKQKVNEYEPETSEEEAEEVEEVEDPEGSTETATE